jgi:tocopherol O-methyltransferase
MGVFHQGASLSVAAKIPGGVRPAGGRAGVLLPGQADDCGILSGGNYSGFLRLFPAGLSKIFAMTSSVTAPIPALDAIRGHYDRISVFYRALWGEHIHHGWFDADESPARAQLQLIERLAARAGIPRGARVLDVGCGVGGSSLWLAREMDCSVLGLTLSPVQAAMAAAEALARGLFGRATFKVADANQLDRPAIFDAVWVIECSEHLTDKTDFIRRCAPALKPGGRLALCAWLRGGRRSGAATRLVREVCDGMLCPDFGSRRDYLDWMKGAGFTQSRCMLITRRVEKTWDICAARAARPEIRALLKVSDAGTRRFVESFAAIRRAYASNAMAYGMFTAVKG